MEENDQNRLHSFVRAHSKTDLINLCRVKNKSVSGTKLMMAMRLLDMEVPQKVKEVKKEIFQPKGNLQTDPSLILKITKNEFGNYTHHDSQLVFDPHQKRVIGVQIPNGTVRALMRCDIELCQKYKFQYNIPVNLDPSPIFEILENSDNEKRDGEQEETLSEEEDEMDEDFEDPEDPEN